jgi:hypothetical protein
MHEGELPRAVELEARDALPAGSDRWLRKFSQLAAIDESLEEIDELATAVWIDGIETACCGDFSG